VDLNRIPQNSEIGEGWRLLSLKATNSVTAGLFNQLANTLRLWDNIAKSIIQSNLSKNGYAVSLPSSNAIDPKLPATGKNFRIRKWYDSKTQTFHFWAHFKKVGK
jgi:hypothetical protein